MGSLVPVLHNSVGLGYTASVNIKRHMAYYKPDMGSSYGFKSLPVDVR